jgi:hypothetical protein
MEVNVIINWLSDLGYGYDPYAGTPNSQPKYAAILFWGTDNPFARIYFDTDLHQVQLKHNVAHPQVEHGLGREPVLIELCDPQSTDKIAQFLAQSRESRWTKRGDTWTFEPPPDYSGLRM